MRIRVAQPEEMLARHRKVRAREPKRTQPKPRNVRVVLTLGDTEFITFRGRAYGVPPVPLKEAKRLEHHRARALEASASVVRAVRLQRQDTGAEGDYWAHMAALQEVLWKLSYRPGIVARWLRRLGLARNPFRDASEAEIMELTAFFSLRRMRSATRPQPANPLLAPRIS